MAFEKRTNPKFDRAKDFKNNPRTLTMIYKQR